MKALTYIDVNKVEIIEVPDPIISSPHDALLRVTSAAICGSDLHMYDGRAAMEKGSILGHEIMGIIEDIGPGVYSIKKGDRVVLPFNISCGTCFNCTHGFMNACLLTNPKKPGAAYGYADMGPYWGGQAEYVRVPFADYNCIKLPGEEGDEFEEDFLLLSDVFPTGYHGAKLANVQAGYTVAVFGAGPVGLLAAYSSILLGASQVFVVDRSKVRLQIAEQMGAIPIDFTSGNPAKQIKEYRRKNRNIMESFKAGEEKNLGVMCGIDAVGYQALSINEEDKEDSMAVLHQLAEVINAGGCLGVIGVYPSQDPNGKNTKAKQGIYEFPWGQIWEKGLSIGTGQCPVKRYAAFLRDLIIAGKAKPSIIISHRLSLEEAPTAYELFNLRGMNEGKDYTKVILHPKLNA